MKCKIAHNRKNAVLEMNCQEGNVVEPSKIRQIEGKTDFNIIPVK